LQGGQLTADTMIGGSGNDTYFVDHVGDVVTETSVADGTDLVRTSVNYTLSDFVENLTATGDANLHLTGNDLENVITGNTGNNTLDGGGGADVLRGGDGNDTYIVDSPADVIEEGANAGTDTIIAGVSYKLAENSNVEKLSAMAGRAGILLVGNA
ncbi:calcium-binding protein, partial [Corallococcus exiguus]|nr:calcium-binding protein [Corallococcus exiguus]